MSAYLLMPLIQSAFCVGLSVLVIRRGLEAISRRIFLCFLISLVTWGIIIFGMRSSPDTVTALKWEKWLGPIGMITVVTMYHFSVIFTAQRTRRVILIGLYLLCAVLFFLIPTDLLYREMQVKAYGYAPVLGPVMFAVITFTYILVILVIMNLIRYARRTDDLQQRNRSFYILTGIIVLLIGGMFDILPLLGLPLYPGYIIGNIVFCCLTTVAIVKHDLLEINIVLRKGLGNMVTSIMLAVPFMAIYILVPYLLKEREISAFVSFLLMVILAFLVPRFWKLIQLSIDRLFYRDRYDYLTAIDTFIRGVKSLNDSKTYMETTLNLLKGALQARRVCFLQPQAPSFDYTLVYCTDPATAHKNIKLAHRGALIEWLRRCDGAVTLADTETVPQLQEPAIYETQLLRRIEIDVLVPLKVRGTQLLGLFLLEKKFAGHPYTSEDKKIMATIGNQVAIFLDNLRLYTDAQRSRENLETWLNTMGDRVIILDSHLRVHFMNKNAIDAFGDRTGELYIEVLGVDILNGISEKNVVTQGVMVTIDNRNYDIAVGSLPDPEGNISLVLSLRDVTLRMKMEQELIRTQKLESIGILAGEIAHDFNNLLTGVLGNVNFVNSNAQLKESEKECMHEAESAIFRAKDLTNQLLTFLRGETPIMNTLSLPGIIRDAVEFARRGTNIKAEYSLPDDLWSVEADEGQLNRVVSNLVINAIQAKPKDNAIHISAENIEGASDDQQLPGAGKYIRLILTDYGKGTPSPEL